MRANSGVIVWVLFPLLFHGLFTGGAVWAEEEDALPEFLRPGVEISTEKNFKSGFKGSPAEVSLVRHGIKVSYMGFSLQYFLSRYDWDNPGASGLTGHDSSPWHKLHRLMFSTRMIHRMPFEGEVLFMYGLRISSAFERQMANSFGAGADISLLKRLSENWIGSIGAGVVYNPLGFDIMPALGFRYEQSGESGLSGAIGMPSYFGYRFDERWKARMELGLSSGTYRLRDDSPASEKGYFRRRAAAPRLTLGYRPFPKLSVAATGIYYFERQWRLYDSSGSRLEKNRLKSGPGAAISAEWRF